MSEYLSEEEQVARMKSWWDQYGTSVLVSVVAAVLIAVGWNWFQGQQQSARYAASDAYVAYTQGSEDDRAAALELLNEQFAGTAYQVMALLAQAQAALNRGDNDAAEAALMTVVEGGDDLLLVDLARLRLAKLQQSLNRSSEALVTLAAIRSEGYRPWALEAKGDIHASRGELQQAYEAYSVALDSLGENVSRPLLMMKKDNVAPSDGVFVPFSEPLADALEEARETLSQSTEVPAVEATAADTADEVLPAIEESDE